MTLMDNNRAEVLKVNRPYRCSCCCCPCFLQELEVTDRTGRLLGSITQEWSILQPIFKVRDSSGESVLRIEGPICVLNCCGDIEFKVLTLNGENKVGKITKQWSGLTRELFTDADYFGVNFPMDLDVNIKAVLLAATFLIVSSIQSS